MKTHNYCVDDGVVTLELAASSADVRLTKDLQTKEGVAKETYISNNASAIEVIEDVKQLMPDDHVYSVMGAYVGPASSFDRLVSMY